MNRPNYIIKSVKRDPFTFASGSGGHSNLMVSSHERSGTHFLINTLANHTLYTNQPLIHFDPMIIGNLVDFHNVQHVQHFFKRLRHNSCLSIIKNHFDARFFQKHSANVLTSTTKIVYILRDPFETISSFRRFIQSENRVGRREGPFGEKSLEFALAEPVGNMVRYQQRGYSTIIERWMEHVKGWIDLSLKSENVYIITYAMLNEEYSSTVAKLCDFIDVPPPNTYSRPDRINNTIYVPGVEAESDAQMEEFLNSLRNTMTERQRKTFDGLKGLANSRVEIHRHRPGYDTCDLIF